MYEDVPVDRRERLIALLGIEGQISSDWQGLGPDDVVYRGEGWEFEEED